MCDVSSWFEYPDFTDDDYDYYEIVLRHHGINVDDFGLENDVLFGMVMAEPENARGLLERVLGIEIEEFTFHASHSRVDAGIGAKWVELDVHSIDKARRHFDIEMQTVDKDDLVRRSRYYVSAMDTSITRRGAGYKDLPDAYVVFICLEDPFGEGLRRYTFEAMCRENGMVLGDGVLRIFLNATGTIGEENSDVSALLDRLVGDNESDNSFVAGLLAEAERIKADRKRRYALMKLECDRIAIARVNREEGIEEGRLQVLSEDARLAEALEAADRASELIQAVKDPAYREQLLAEFGIE